MQIATVEMSWNRQERRYKPGIYIPQRKILQAATPKYTSTITQLFFFRIKGENEAAATPTEECASHKNDHYAKLKSFYIQ